MATTTANDKTVVSETKDSGLIRDFVFPLPGFIRALPEWARVTLILFILVVVSLFIRSRSVGQQFWMDEAITVGIASHHLSAIPGIMRQDGSPPLFYLLLHFWMQMVGNGEAATHWLSEIFAVLTIPLGYWGGVKIAGKRAGLMTATLMASSAFLDYYSQETRMYALMTLLGLLGTIGFIRGFVFRERRYVILFSLSLAAMLYTHNWALFFGAGSVLSLVVLYYISGDEIRENLIRDAIYAYVGAAILFAPWVLNFIFQSLHTAAPWNTSPRFGAPVQIAQSVYGGSTVAAILLIGAAVGYAGLFTKAQRASTPAKIALILFTLVFFTLLFGWIASQITPAWNPRYFAPIVPGIMMFTAIGMSRAGLVGALTLAVALVFLARPGTYAPTHKSDMQDIGGEMGPLMHPRDLVIVGQPESTPLAYYYLPAGLRFSSTIGPVRDPSFVNWVNAMSRFRAANPTKVLTPMLNNLKPGQQVLYIRPLTEGVIGWKAPWTSLIRTRSAIWGRSSRTTSSSRWRRGRPTITVAPAASRTPPFSTSRSRSRYVPETSVSAAPAAAPAAGADITAQTPVVVLGGGPAGLTAGYLLAKQGKPAVILESTDMLGGIARTEVRDGYRFDLGGHRFFTKVKEVDDLWHEIMKEEFLKRPRQSRIYWNDKFLEYPLEGMDVIRKLGLWELSLCMGSYLWAQVKPKGREDTFEEWVSNRFGKRLYNHFFKTYTEKLWGVPTDEIRAEWAAQRIKGLSFFSAARAAFLGNKGNKIKSLISEFNYPRFGPGQMWEQMAKDIQEQGGEIRMNAPVTKLVTDGEGRVVEVHAGGEILTPSYVISSLPLRTTVGIADPEAPVQVRDAARGLRYREFLTVLLVIEGEDLFPDNWIYIHQPGVRVLRIQNFKSWSPWMVPNDNDASIGMEYFCFEGDELWNMEDDKLVEMAGQEIEKLKLAKAANVKFGFVARVHKAYPIYDEKYAERVATIRSWLEHDLTNLSQVGRNGLHRYNNSDHSMLTAMRAVDNITLGTHHDIWQVNVESVYHEEVHDNENPYATDPEPPAMNNPLDS